MVIAGTHDIQGLQMMSAMDLELAVVYSEHSCAAGALFVFVFLNENGNVDFTQSAFLVLNRSTLLHYSPPHAGDYLVFVYDIEQDGTLQDGVGYPAVTTNFTMEWDREGLNWSCLL